MASFETDKEILVLDNDECLGNFTTCSLMMSIFINAIILEHNPVRRNVPLDEYYSNMVYPYMDVFVRYLEKGLARPFLKEFIQKIYQLKLDGKIKKVVMYTAATNQYGWVTFLSKLIPTYAGVPLEFYDVVLSRTHTKYRNNVYMKNLLYVNIDTSKIVMIDDSPQNIIKLDATVIPISKYLQHVSPLDHDFMKFIPEQYHSISLNAIKHDETLHTISTLDYSSDKELLIMMDHLDQSFK